MAFGAVSERLQPVEHLPVVDLGPEEEEHREGALCELKHGACLVRTSAPRCPALTRLQLYQSMTTEALEAKVSSAICVRACERWVLTPGLGGPGRYDPQGERQVQGQVRPPGTTLLEFTRRTAPFLSRSCRNQ
eukprot:2345193-Rhodomonas_salina.1